MGRPNEGRRRLAMLMWGDVVEDFLAPIGWSLDDMLARMTGGWFFGYIDALSRCGVECVPVLFTREARTPAVAVHAPSGVRVRLVHWTPAYRFLRSQLHETYTWLSDGEHIEGDTPALLRPVRRWARDQLPFLATPAPALRRVLSEESCDALLCQEYEDARFDVATAVGKALGIPVFATFQGATLRRSRLEATRRPGSMASAAGFIIGASRERERVEASYGVTANRIAAVFNPVDVRIWFPDRDRNCRRELGVPDDSILVVWHGRVDMRRKGIDILIDSWRRYRALLGGQRANLLLIGTGRDAAELRALLEADTDVIWLDRYIDDRAMMRRYLSCADISVLPSRLEGFPVAPLEAMACGLPIVAARAQGVEDIFAHGEADGGILVPREDPGALAAALHRLTRDPSARKSLGELALKRVRTAFDPDTVGKQLAEFLFANLPA